MKRLLLPLLAALALPTAVNAEAVLILKTGLEGYGTATTIKMKDMKTCSTALNNLKSQHKIMSIVRGGCVDPASGEVQTIYFKIGKIGSSNLKKPLAY